MPGIFRKAKSLLRNPENLLALLKQGVALAYARRGALVYVFEEFLALIRLVKAWVTGTYRESPKTVIFWAVVAILYFISPLDAFPDILPGGYLDDIAFISFIAKRIKDDLDKFLAWEKSQKPGS
jgi:uncharacterized membrane protein YkvA (DUF1232 family)